MIRRALLVVALLVAAAAATQMASAQKTSGCALSSITISKPTMRRSSTDYVRLTGILRHSCQQAVGVQLKWTGFAADGSVFFSDEFWPASTRNIQPNFDYAFETLQRDDGKVVRFVVDPLSSTVWQ